MKNTALLSVCKPSNPKHLQSIDIEIIVSFGAKQFMTQMTQEEATQFATELMIEVCKRNLA